MVRCKGLAELSSRSHDTPSVSHASFTGQVRTSSKAWHHPLILSGRSGANLGVSQCARRPVPAR